MYHNRHHQFKVGYNHKLGFHIGYPSNGALNAAVQIKPNVIKVMDFSYDYLHMLRTHIPGVMIIGRLYEPNQNYNAYYGRLFGDKVLSLDINHRTFEGEPMIKYWESFNEAIPGQASPDEHMRYDEFQVAFADRMFKYDFEPIAFNWGTGNDNGAVWVEHYPGTLETYTWLGFHEYSWPTMQESQSWLALRYRRTMGVVRHSDFYGDKHSVVITECGLGQGTKGGGDLGWNHHEDTTQFNVPMPMDPDTYWSTLEWYNRQLMKDDYVAGACLFQTGVDSGRWATFEGVPAITSRLFSFQRVVEIEKPPDTSQIAKYPRPENDTGIGVHWAPDLVWDKEHIREWAVELKALGVKWVKYLDHGSGENLEFGKWLISLGIMPVVRVYLHPNYPNFIGGQQVELARKYAEYGIYYIEFGNEPDLDEEWDGAKPDNWMELVVDRYIDLWDKVRPFGTIPLFDAFGPGGRGNPFQMIVDKGRADIFEWMVIPVHNYTLGRPLEYPNDGIADLGTPYSQEAYEGAFNRDDWGEVGKEPWQWVWERTLEDVNAEIARLANPDIDIMQDSTGFRAYEYINQLVVDAVGYSVPIMMTEGGPNVGQRAGTTAGDDFRYPKPTPFWQAEQTMRMWGGPGVFKLPDYYITQMPWLWGVKKLGSFKDDFEAQGPWYGHWYDSLFNLSGELPVVQRLKDHDGIIRQDGPRPEQWARYDEPPEWQGREMDHELLLLEPQVGIHPVEQDFGFDYWRVVKVSYMERGQGYVYFRCLGANGQILEGVKADLIWDDGVAEAETKGVEDKGFGDFPFHSQPLGTYTLKIAGPSDLVVNLGNGRPDNTSEPCNFYVTYQIHEGGQDMGWEWAVREDERFLANEAAGSPVDLEDPIYGIAVQGVPGDSYYWKCIGVYHLTGAENNGNHNVYIGAYDQYGQLLHGLPEVVRWKWEGMRPEETPRNADLKMSPERGDIGMGGNQVITIEIELLGYPSERVMGLRSSHPDEEPGNNWGHHSFYVVYQVKQREAVSPSPEPPVEPPVDNSWITDLHFAALDMADGYDRVRDAWKQIALALEKLEK